MQQCLAAHHDRKPIFLDVYPVDEKVEKDSELSADTPLFVDVGGGFGPQSIAFKKQFPDILGRVIIEDSSATLEQAQKFPGVETLVQDFFEPQKIKGQSILTKLACPFCHVNLLLLSLSAYNKHGA